jgi:hypothetical protein
MCYLCRTPEEFSEKLRFALSSEPQPLSSDDRQRLTWEAATERFLDVDLVSRVKLILTVHRKSVMRVRGI